MPTIVRICTAFALAAAPAALLAAWVPGAELVGQSVQVRAGDTTNTVFFDQGGQARIVTAAGRSVPASWTASNGQLCLYSGGGQECWPYSSPFEAGRPAMLTSNCSTASEWLANAVNPVDMAPPQPQTMPERG